MIKLLENKKYCLRVFLVDNKSCNDLQENRRNDRIIKWRYLQTDTGVKQIITQKNFVEKLKRRNEKALEYVIREYGGYVKAAVNHNLAGLPEEMEECMDDVFLDVWEHIERFDAAKGSFRNWIISIARFRSIDYLRRYSRTCMEENVSNYESKLARNDRIDTLEQEISTETEKLLEGLKEEERQILLRYYAEEDDVDVLAKEYGVSSSTIYSKVSRAKKKVRKNHGRLEEHVWWRYTRF